EVVRGTTQISSYLTHPAGYLGEVVRGTTQVSSSLTHPAGYLGAAPSYLGAAPSYLGAAPSYLDAEICSLGPRSAHLGESSVASSARDMPRCLRSQRRARNPPWRSVTAANAVV